MPGESEDQIGAGCATALSDSKRWVGSNECKQIRNDALIGEKNKQSIEGRLSFHSDSLVQETRTQLLILKLFGFSRFIVLTRQQLPCSI